jgi:threonine/homoserine efflux transporter RhtA
MFFLVFGICLLFMYDQIIIPIGIAVFITFVSQIIWAVWESKFSS